MISTREPLKQQLNSTYKKNKEKKIEHTISIIDMRKMMIKDARATKKHFLSNTYFLRCNDDAERINSCLGARSLMPDMHLQKQWCNTNTGLEIL